MADETTSVASSPEPASTPAPAPAPDETVNLEAPQQDTSVDSQTESDQLQPDDDDDDYELDGRKFRAPKSLKERMMLHADYTRKTQATAELRRELEAREQSFAQQAQQSEQEMDARADLRAAQKELERYRGVDWPQWMRQDPIGAQEARIHYEQTRETYENAKGFLDGTTQQRTQAAQRETAQRIEQTRDWAQKNIKGWTPEVDQKVTDFATRELGFTPSNLRDAINPQVYRAIHLAWIGHQAISKPAAPKPQAAPLQTVQARTAPGGHKSPADMSMDEYVAYRTRQNAARGR